MHTHIVRRRLLVIAGAALLPCAIFSPTQATTITNGAYLGAPGADASGSDTNHGGNGGNAYTFSGGSNLITGGEFFGGNGGNATGGEMATAGGGGNGVELENTGSLTITGGSFQGGQGGTASGADANSNGYEGEAVELVAENPSTLVLVYGGTFAGGYDFLIQGGVCEVYGSFAGGPRTISTLGNDTGTFSGLLQDNTTSATYSYDVSSGGELIIEPEPTACAALIIPSIMLIRRRSRRT